MQETTIKRNPRAAWRTFEGSTLVITPDDKMIHELNETASAIWSYCSSETGIDSNSIIAPLLDIYDISRESAEREIAEFVADAARKGIIIID